MRGIPRLNLALAFLVLTLGVTLFVLQLCRWRTPDSATMTHEFHEMVAAMQAFLEVGPAPFSANGTSPGARTLWNLVAIGAALGSIVWMTRRWRAQQRSRSKRS